MRLWSGCNLQPSLRNDQYELISYVQASGCEKIKLGQKGICRFCGNTQATSFRKTAHTFPEGIGNRWITSLDECDECNSSRFSKFDDALCASIGPILTIGGTKGKSNKVRQSGRTRGSHSIKHHNSDGKRRISVNLLDKAKGVSTPLGTSLSFTPDGMMFTQIPTPNESFVPRDAYKCLVKCGLALMPIEELVHFSRLLEWIIRPDESREFPYLDVGIALGSIGNAPGLVSGAVLRRRNGVYDGPYAIFIMCAGSVCWQILLAADDLDEGRLLPGFGQINFVWKNVLGPPDAKQIEIVYSQPQHFDWSSRTSCLTPVSSILGKNDLTSGAASFDVSWREMHPQ